MYQSKFLAAISIAFFTTCYTPQILSAQEMPLEISQSIDSIDKIFTANPEVILSNADNDILEKAVQWVIKHPKHNSYRAAQAYQMRGSVLQSIGHLLKAEPYFEDALAITDRLIAIQETDSLRLLRGNLASFVLYGCLKQADFEGAMAYSDLSFKEFEAIQDTRLNRYKAYYLIQTYANQAGIYEATFQPQLTKNAIRNGRKYLDLPYVAADVSEYGFLILNLQNFEALSDLGLLDSLGHNASTDVSDSIGRAAIQKFTVLLKNQLPQEMQFAFLGHLINANLRLSQPLNQDSIFNILQSMEKLTENSQRLKNTLSTYKSLYYLKFKKWQEAEKEIIEALDKIKNTKSAQKDIYLKVQYPIQYWTLLINQIKLYKLNPAKHNEIDSLKLADLYDEFIILFDNYRETAQEAQFFKTYTGLFLSIFKEATEFNASLFQSTNEEKYLQKMLEYSERGRNFIQRRNILKKQEANSEIRRITQRQQHFKLRLAASPTDKNAKDSLAYYASKNSRLDSMDYIFTIPQIRNVRQRLLVNNGVGFIEFTAVSKTRLVGLVITQDTAFSFQTDSLVVILKLAQQFESQSWKKSEYKDDEYGNFHVAQSRIYQLLLADILKQLPTSINRLVIVPDSKLAVLPFGALLTESIKGRFIPNRDTGYYLAKKYALTLMPSFNIYDVLPTKPLTKNAITVGLSACFDVKEEKNRPLDSLISFVQKKAGQGHYLQICNKKEMLSVLSKIKTNEIPIIVAHGDIEAKDYNDYGFLLSNTERLNSLDIMRENFNFPFAILAGSCNTAVGIEERGEGFATLARSCMQAGVSSLLATTIDINEREAAQLLDAFFTYFKPEGVSNNLKYYPKDVALQKAQMDMIDKKLHPVNWAHIVLIGDFSPLQDKY